MVRTDKPQDYKFLKYRKSTTKGKKYDAILEHKRTGKRKIIPFGSLLNEHYKDTALGLYSHLDHKDEKRRKSFKARHGDNIKYKFSSAYFADKALW